MTAGDRVLQDAEKYVFQVWGNGNCNGLAFTVSADVNMPIFYSLDNYPGSETGPYGNTASTLLNDTSTSNAFTFTTPVSGPSGPFTAGDLGSVHAQSDTYDDGWQLVNGTAGSFTAIDDSSAATEPQPGDLFYGVIERNDATMSVHAGIVQSYSPTDHMLTLIDDFDALKTGNGLLAGGALIGPTTFTVGAPQPAGSGIYAIDGYFALYRLTDTTPPIEPQSTLPVAMGGAATISHGFLWSVDPDNAPAQLTYTILSGSAHGRILDNGVAATSFTQADIDNGLVKYVENGDSVKSDSFTFTVSDLAGNSTETETFSIAVLDHAGPVVTGGGKLSVAAGGVAPLLNPALDTVSLGNTPDQIAYTLLLPPEHGLILENGAPATGFTQADIDSHRVQYVASGDSATSDGFIFQVSDAAGAHTAPQFFAIEVGGESGDLVLSSGGSTGIALQTTNPTFTFEDVSNPIGRADDAVPAGSGLAGEGGSAVQGDTSMSDLLAYWALMQPSGGDSQG